MILVWVQNILWCDNTHDAHNHPIKLKQRPTTKITGLSALDTEASLLLYMPLLPPCTLERLRFVFSAGSKSSTIVHAHPSHFITTSELILEDFRESQANFASETLIFLFAAEHEMNIKLMNNISRKRWPLSLGFSIFITQYVAILHLLGTSEWMCLSLEHSALKCKTKVAMAPRPILVFSATTSRLFQSDPVGFQLLKRCHKQRLQKVFMGLFHGMEREVLLYRPHVKTRDLSGFDQRWQQLCGNEPRLWKAAMSVNQPSVESWTRASRSQVTRTEIYVFINAIYFGCWFGMREFMIFFAY